MKIKFSFSKLILSLTAFLICVFLMPVIANASPYTEGQKYISSDGAMIYVDEDNNDAWIVNEETWTKAVYDSSLDFNNASLEIRNAMYSRDTSYSGIVAFPKALMDITQYNERGYYYLDELFNTYLLEAVYKDDGNPYGGDYLRQTAKISRNTYPVELSVSKSSTEYCFVRVTYYFSYVTTAKQEQQVKDFVELWNYYYVDSNSTINNAKTQKEREYYIVKTIYNFATKNIEYDNDVYYDINREKYPVTHPQYLASHSAYGAIFGNLEGAYTDDFDPSVFQVNRVRSDSQGLYRVDKLNQGKAVCEGYSLLFYYMCKYNGIECRIVTGDYDYDASGRGSDPHAWNMVYLQDSVEEDYEWYSIDTTFASQRTQKLNEIYTVVDYSYFLRGTENEAFSAQKHQQSYLTYDGYRLSADDFRFEVGEVYTQSSSSDIDIIAIVSRMKTDDPDEKYVKDGDYIYENYVIIDTNGNLYNIDKDNGNHLYNSNGFTYYSTGYYYTCEFIDFAQGIEYTSQGKYLLDVDTYSFELTTVLSNNAYTMSFDIYPLPMGDLSKNYDLSATKINDSELSSVDLSENKLKLQAEFTGTTIDFDASIVDSAGTTLNTVNEDFKTFIGIPNGSSFTLKSITAPGMYYMRIQYYGNYSGYVDIPIEITKADFSRYVRSVVVTFGSDISAQKSFKFGNDNEYVVITNGTDFKITNVTPYANVGDTGTLVLTALSTSNYLEAGTSTTWTYTVTTPLDLSSAYANWTISDQNYTGSAIEPKIANPTYSGKTVELVKDRDYTVTYSNNVNVGTATMTVQFIGNYTGSFTKNFNIVKSGGSSGGNSSEAPKLGWMQHDGYWVYVSKIETVNGKTNVTLLTGWLKDGGKWYYLIPGSGRMATGWTSVSNKWYYFNSSGVMQTGWLTIGGKRYYCNSSGVMLTGWQKISNKWYYFNTSGVMLTGWQKISNKWYYFNSSGVMLTGWQKISNKWYYFNSSGAMLTGWQKISNKWYYFNSAGDMRTGWLKSSGKWYYFNSSGAMVTSNTKINGKAYRFNSSGVCLNP